MRDCDIWNDLGAEDRKGEGAAPFREPNSERHVKNLISSREQARTHIEEREPRTLHVVVTVLVGVAALESAQHKAAGGGDEAGQRGRSVDLS